jgi:hypothetical protein
MTPHDTTRVAEKIGATDIIKDLDNAAMLGMR